MAFTLPTFNVTAGIYRNARGSSVAFPTGAPDVSCVANLSSAKRIWFPDNSATVTSQWMLCPIFTDVRDGIHEQTLAPDWVEIPAGTGCWYNAAEVVFCGLGFPNQHIAVQLSIIAAAQPAWAVPYPSSPPPAPPPNIVFRGNFTSINPVNFYNAGFTMLAEQIILVVFNAQNPQAPITAVSSIDGVLTQAYSFPTGGGTINQGTIDIFVYTSVGGADVITFALANPGVVGGVMYHSTQNTPDTGGFATGLTTVPQLSGVAPPTAANNELALLAVLVTNDTPPDTFGLPFVELVGSGIQAGDAFDTWRLYIGGATIPIAGSSAIGSWTTTLSVGSVIGWGEATFI